MKYSLEIEINLPRRAAALLFADPAHYAQWQAGLVSFAHVGGAPGTPGAQAKIVEKAGGRKIEITETLLARDLPAETSFLYEASGVWNRIRHRFEETAPERTKWIMESEFRCRGWIRLLAFLAPGMFKNQTRSYLRAFKEFAENRGGD